MRRWDPPVAGPQRLSSHFGGSTAKGERTHLAQLLRQAHACHKFGVGRPPADKGSVQSRPQGVHRREGMCCAPQAQLHLRHGRHIAAKGNQCKDQHRECDVVVLNARLGLRTRAAVKTTGAHPASLLPGRTRGGSSGSAELNSCLVTSSSVTAPVFKRCWIRSRRIWGTGGVSFSHLPPARLASAGKGTTHLFHEEENAVAPHFNPVVYFVQLQGRKVLWGEKCSFPGEPPPAACRHTHGDEQHGAPGRCLGSL
jgi:hypothetical protein